MKDREEVPPAADSDGARPSCGTVKLEPLTLGANMGHATDDFRLAVQVRSSESARAVHEEEVAGSAGTGRRRWPGAGVLMSRAAGLPRADHLWIRLGWRRARGRSDPVS